MIAPFVQAVSVKLKDFDPATIFSCIIFSRPMDESLQRHSLNVAFLNGMQAGWLGMPQEEMETVKKPGFMPELQRYLIFMTRWYLRGVIIRFEHF